MVSFDTAPPASVGSTVGPGFSVTEGAITYDVASGSLYVGTGNPGLDIEGDGAAGGGVLRLVATGPFRFLGLDFAAYDDIAGRTGSLTVTGLLHGAVQGQVVYTLGTTASYDYDTWTAEGPGALAGRLLDTLVVNLPASASDFGSGGTTQFWSAVDNVALDLPEPSALVLLAGACGLLALTFPSLRRPRV